jgi:hypothetical protein
LASGNLPQFPKISPKGIDNPIRFPLFRHSSINQSEESTFFTCVAGWSSLVARQAHNLKVLGSNPSPAPMKAQWLTHWAFAIYMAINGL